jgi:LCP family protein required for cell wall assembly
MNNKKKKQLPKSIQIMLIITNLLTLLFLLTTIILNVIPTKYLIIIIIVLLLIDIITSILLIKRKPKLRLTGIILSFIFMILLSIGLVYEIKTNSFFDIITKNKKVVENYLIVVKKDKFKDIKELSDIATLNIHDVSYKNAKEKLKKIVDIDNIDYDNTTSMVEDLLKDKIDSILIEESQEKIISENEEDYSSKTTAIYKFKVEYKESAISKDTDITKKSFNVYISGIDTYNSINSVSRSDVNMVVSINPNTHKISLVSIPRDYYVPLYGKEGYKDKLTHAGIYGVETSIKTIENLLDIDINYYVKFNFNSIIKLVDALNGITVNSEYNFESGLYDENTTQVYKYKKGENKLNGKQALSFARERYSFADGDRVRAAHQQEIISSIIDKVTSPSIVVNYTSLLDAMSDTFVTNLDSDNLKKFIKKILDENSKWEVEKLVLNGTGSMEYTYSYPKQKLYVMLGDEEEIKSAKEQINRVLN